MPTKQHCSLPIGVIQLVLFLSLVNTHDVVEETIMDMPLYLQKCRLSPIEVKHCFWLKAQIARHAHDSPNYFQTVRPIQALSDSQPSLTLSKWLLFLPHPHKYAYIKSLCGRELEVLTLGYFLYFSSLSRRILWQGLLSSECD